MRTLTSLKALLAPVLLLAAAAADGGALEGNVYGNGVTLAGVEVRLYAAGEATPIASAITDGAGRYAFADLATGTYDLFVRPVPATRYRGVTMAGVAVQDDTWYSSSTTTQHVLLLHANAELFGSVTDAAGKALGEGHSVLTFRDADSGLRVYELDSRDTSWWSSWGGTDFHAPLGNGEYAVDYERQLVAGVTEGAGGLHSSLACFWPDPQTAESLDPDTVACREQVRITGVETNLLVDGPTTAPINLPLVRLSGTVRDADGIAMPNETIIVQRTLIDGARETRIDSVVSTDSNGQYSLVVPAGLDSFTVYQAPEPILYAYPRARMTVEVVFAPLAADAVVDVTMPRAGRVHVAHGNWAGDPLDYEGMYAVYVLESGGYQSYGQFDSSGFLEVENGVVVDLVVVLADLVPLGSNLSLTPFAGLAISGDTSADLDTPLVTVSGVVRDTLGNPVPGARVRVFDDMLVSLADTILFNEENPFGVLAPAHWANGTSVIEVVADVNGNYQFVALPGIEHVMVLPPEGSVTLWPTMVTGLNVTADQVLDLAFTAPRTFSGVLRDLDGNPVADAAIAVDFVPVIEWYFYDSGDWRSDGASRRVVQTDANGAFSIPLADGAYDVEVHPPGISGARRWNFDPVLPDCTGVTLDEFAIAGSDLNCDIQINARRITGLTRDADGVPVAGVTIDFFNGDRAWIDEAPDALRSIGVSDESGAYAMYIWDFGFPGTWGADLLLTPPAGSPYVATANHLFGLDDCPGSYTGCDLPVLSASRLALGLDLWATPYAAGGSSLLPRVFDPAAFRVSYAVVANDVYEALRVEESCTPFCSTDWIPTPWMPANYALRDAAYQADEFNPSTGSWMLDLALGYNYEIVVEYHYSQVDEFLGETWQDEVIRFALGGGPYSGEPEFKATTPGDWSPSAGFDLATLRGRVIDENGVLVHNVVVRAESVDSTDLMRYGGLNFDGSVWATQQVTTDCSFGSGGWNCERTGGYEMLVPYGVIDQLVVEPRWTGFPITSLRDIAVTGDTLLDIVLQVPDYDAPEILGGPYVIDLTDTTATIALQTDEPSVATITVGATTYTSQPDGKFGTSHIILVEGLTPSTPYTLDVLASDEYGNGPTTAAVAFTTGATPDTRAPTFVYGPVVTAIGDNRAVVEWETDEATAGEVHFGIGGMSGSAGGGDPAGTRHQVVLEGLAADSTYDFEVVATDAAGNTATSGGGSFATLPVPDTSAPVIVGGPVILDVSDSGVTIGWTTDEPARSGVSLTDGTAHKAYGDETPVINHVVHITGLDAATTYEYAVSSTDVHGNGPTLSGTQSFTTRAAPDANPPVLVEGLRVLGITHQSAVVQWRTDEPAGSVVEYGLSPGALTQVAVDTKMKTTHIVHLTGLADGTTYYLRARSVDAAGNEVVSAIESFTTHVQPDTVAPKFTVTPSVIGRTDRSVTIAWSTDEVTVSRVEYGVGAVGERSLLDGRALQRHRVTLTGLSAGTNYSFAVTATDVAGNATRYESLVATVMAPPARPALDVAALLLGAGVAHADGILLSGLATDTVVDLSAPAFTSGPSVTWATTNRALLQFTTDEPVSVEVRYAPVGSGAWTYRALLAPALSDWVMLTNLDAGASYEYELTARDVAGNATTAGGTFDTAGSADVSAPVLSGIGAAPGAVGYAMVSWSSDEPATHEVLFGTSAAALDDTAFVEGYDDAHDVVLTNLSAGVTYYYRVRSVDAAGNVALSPVSSFTAAGGSGGGSGGGGGSGSGGGTAGGGGGGGGGAVGAGLLLTAVGVLALRRRRCRVRVAP